MRYILYILSLWLFVSCSETPSTAPIDSLRDVTIDINMSSEDSFDLSNDSLTVLIDSVGEFGMTDSESSGNYSVTVPDLVVGRSYEYLYAINGEEEELSTKRSFAVSSDLNFFTDYVIGQLNPAVLVFRVDMSLQIESGDFNPISQSINIVGDMNGWSGTVLESLPDEDSKYEIVITDLTVGDEIMYKYRIGEDGWETPNPEISSCVSDGYGGYNRYHVVAQEERVLDSWFNDSEGN